MQYHNINSTSIYDAETEQIFCSIIILIYRKIISYKCFVVKLSKNSISRNKFLRRINLFQLRIWSDNESTIELFGAANL